jgi:ribosome maturation factor RimP
MMNPLEQKIADLIAPAIIEMGFRLVLVEQTSEDGQAILRIMAEDPETSNLLLDDCAAISRHVGALLDVENLISGVYRLEISSPGIDRPLIILSDFENALGSEAKIEIAPPLDGRKRFRGILKEIHHANDTPEIVIQVDQTDYALALDTIIKARLVLNDDLIERSKKMFEARQKQKEEKNKPTETNEILEIAQ